MCHFPDPGESILAALEMAEEAPPPASPRRTSACPRDRWWPGIRFESIRPVPLKGIASPVGLNRVHRAS